MTSRVDHLFDELDRQLLDVREQANSIASRSTLVLTVTAVSAAVLSARIQREAADYRTALWPLGVSLVASLISIAPNLAIGPTNAALSGWQLAKDSKVALGEMYIAKLGLLEVNKQRLSVMAWAFYVALVAAIVAIAISLIAGGSR